MQKLGKYIEDADNNSASGSGFSDKIDNYSKNRQMIGDTLQRTLDGVNRNPLSSTKKRQKSPEDVNNQLARIAAIGSDNPLMKNKEDRLNITNHINRAFDAANKSSTQKDNTFALRNNNLSLNVSNHVRDYEAGGMSANLG